MRHLAPLGLVFLFACSSQESGALRKVTYGRDFHYLEKQQVRGAMDKIAKEVVALEALLRAEAAPEQAQVVLHLDGMIAAAGELEGSASASNHPILDANLPTFRRDLTAARAAAAKDPPNYYLAGSVAGACQYCHH